MTRNEYVYMKWMENTEAENKRIWKMNRCKKKKKQQQQE